MKDFYYILGVDPDCSFNEIQSAYTKLSEKFRPDLNSGDKYFKSRFDEINEAYDRLGSPYNRRQYDQQLKAFKLGGEQEQTSARSAGRSGSGIGIGMTVVLIVIAFILGDYIFQYFKKASPKKAKETIAANVVTDTVPKKHKRHHLSKNRLAKDSIAHHQPKLATSAVKPKVTRPVLEKRAPISKSISARYVALKSLVDSSKKQSVNQNNDVLYTTRVSPNATGVVNLRSQDAYNSPVFATIPANSKVFVLQRGATYYKVLFHNYTGYVPKWALQIK